VASILGAFLPAFSTREQRVLRVAHLWLTCFILRITQHAPGCALLRDTLIILSSGFGLYKFIILWENYTRVFQVCFAFIIGNVEASFKSYNFL
jgi:hypothetical protein